MELVNAANMVMSFVRENVWENIENWIRQEILTWPNFYSTYHSELILIEFILRNIFSMSYLTKNRFFMYNFVIFD